jgi:hypothetical protein
LSTNFGQEFHIQKEENISLSTSIRKRSMCGVQLKVYVHNTCPKRLPCDSMHASGQPRPFKDAEIVADSLTGIHSAMVKCFFIVNRSCTHKGGLGVPEGKHSANRLTDGGEVASLMRRPPFTPQEDSWYSFLSEAESILRP